MLLPPVVYPTGCLTVVIEDRYWLIGISGAVFCIFPLTR
uniref:Uncharacterized protein n=1 Tax=Klebsiella pneumoniae TaxID=573 RepID=A0A8B0SRD0_KLEPN|nr:hypothetical protein [Klebsiella pneumoniae]